MNLFTPKLRSRRAKKFALVVGLFAIACFVQATMLNGKTRTLQSNDKSKSWDKDNHDLVKVDGASLQDDIPPRPVMSTFYEPVKGGCCGMSEGGHQSLLDAWEKGWHDMGWETRILTEEDAKKHRDFWTVEEKLKALGIGEYNRRCYWRWLAMASQAGGGGWMSDYDAIPLSLTAQVGQELSKDGSFKSYGMTVPCLIHASREEWDRVIHLMVEQLHKKEKGVISDMNSLRDLHYWVKGINLFDDVVRRWPYTINDEGVMVIDCKQANHFKAAHLSHFGTGESFKAGHYPKLEGVLPSGVDNIPKVVAHRGEAAVQLIEDIREQCAPTISIATTK